MAAYSDTSTLKVAAHVQSSMPLLLEKHKFIINTLRSIARKPPTTGGTGPQHASQLHITGDNSQHTVIHYN
jgi:hypothetical protein